MSRSWQYLLAIALVGCGDSDGSDPKENTLDPGLEHTNDADAAVATTSPPVAASSCETRGDCVADAAVAMQMDKVCEVIKRDAPPRAVPVDVIWAIRNEYSAVPLPQIQSHVGLFAKSLDQAGIDYRLIIINRPWVYSAATNISTKYPWDAKTLGVDPKRFVWLDEDGTASTLDADVFSTTIATYPWYSPRLRADSAVHLVVVTADDASTPWPEFREQMEGLLGHELTLHAVADSPNAPCAGAGRAPGRAYWEGAAETGGQRVSICAADWTPVFTAIAQSVERSATLPCQYDIPAAPAGESYSRSKVNVEHVLGTVATPLKRRTSLADCGVEGGWFFDNAADPKHVLVCPASCSAVQEKGGTVRTSFVCDERVLY